MSGKRLLLLIVLVIIAFGLVLGLLQSFDAVWSLWKVPPMKPHFADLRNLTGAAESIRLGHDPLYINPMDPAQRPLNHPRLVQFIVSSLGLDLSSTTLVGIILVPIQGSGRFGANIATAEPLTAA